jgi:hypothetical protein
MQNKDTYRTEKSNTPEQKFSGCINKNRRTQAHRNPHPVRVTPKAKGPAFFSAHVSPELIQSFVDARQSKALAFFYLLKGTYINSRVYKVRRPGPRLASLAGISEATAYRYLRILKDRGLITQDRGAFALVANETIYNRYNDTKKKPHDYRTRKRTIRLTGPVTLVEIEKHLLFKLFEGAAKRQAIDVSLKEYLTGDGKAKNPNKSTGDTFRACLSVRQTGRLLNFSATKAHWLIHAWNVAGLIETTRSDPEFMFFGSRDSLGHLEDIPGYKYYSAGGIYEVRPATHEFLTVNIARRTWTPRRLRRAMKAEKYGAHIRKYLQLIDNEVPLS